MNKSEAWAITIALWLFAPVRSDTTYNFTTDDMETSAAGQWVRWYDYLKLQNALERILDADSSAAQVIARRALNGFAPNGDSNANT